MVGNGVTMDAIRAAIAGDKLSLERLFLAHYDLLQDSIRKELPQTIASRVSVEDLMQVTFCKAFQRISAFQPTNADAFTGWLLTIGRNCVRDAVKKHLGPEANAGRELCQPASGSGGTIANLLDAVLTGNSKATPSRVAACKENEQAVRVALAGLEEDFATAIRLRYLEGLIPREIATRMDRSERAVHMLCNRGLKALREAMGRASLYFSSVG